MQAIHSDWINEITNTIRELLAAESFCHEHRVSPKAFTRKRHFTFVNSMLFLMQKTLRSIQLHLHSFFGALGQFCPVLTPSAWSQARLKLRHTAFVALNQVGILNVIYRDPSHPQLRRWREHRLLALDSSLQRLPNQEELGHHFGWVESSNQSGGCGRYPQGRLSVLTDVLNRFALETFFEPWSRGERELALEHLRSLQAGDLTLMDRGFAEYLLWAAFVHAQRLFVCRCQASSFAVVNGLFAANEAGRSLTVQLPVTRPQVQEVRHRGLPEVITLRFVTVRLSTGELEVLASNLLDEGAYPTDCFGELYHCRWGIETFYGLLKSRLDLGNFTGLTVEAIRQDVHATVLISNLESALIAPTNQKLKEHSAKLKYTQQVNHAVSFHAIKSHIIRLLASQVPLPEVIDQLRRLFLATPITVRPERKVPRRKPSAWRSYNYQRHVRKIVF
jgi:hypothetical protein